MTCKASQDHCSFADAIEPRLLSVQKPARYIGQEPGAIVKPWHEASFRFAYAFPDLYEIGMSYYGREVLCQKLNAREDVLCERAFLPAHDMQELMDRHGVLLWALESKRPVIQFDAIGVSLTHELAFPSALQLLALAGVPLRSEARDDQSPLVIAGGQCMCNPEPVAPFFDLVVNGEGEEVIHEIIDTLLLVRGEPRADRLLALTRLAGCYVPRFYEPRHDEDGRSLGVHPARNDIPQRIERRYLQTFAQTTPPVRPVQPYIEVPSDKAYLEVMRGCPQGCRFCQAGYITRPARARPVAELSAAARTLACNTGADEVGLLGLSTLDHPEVLDLVAQVKQTLPTGTGVAVPSLRADAITLELARALRRPRETSLTLAIEAGTDARRRAINKRVTEEELRASFAHLAAAGWHKFKLYFMCGFAGEQLEEMDDVADTVRVILDTVRDNGPRRPRLNVSMSVLVPKAHTPLQWQAMERPELTRRKQARLASRLKRFGDAVKLHWHSPEQAVVEALLSRGGRELAPVLEDAMQAGQTLLSDHFDYGIWLDLLDRHGIDLDQQVFRERARDEPLPWDHIDRGLRKEYLRSEWQAYLDGEPTPPCHEECTGCGLGCGAPLFG